MREKGLWQFSLWRLLKKLLKADNSFKSGRIIGSMCTSPHPLAERVFRRYLEKNVGDPGLFPATIALEAEAITALASLLGLKNATGYIVSGGTEANILALWAAKKASPPEKREVVLSEAAHFSFDKAASLLDLKLIKVPVKSDGSLNLKQAAQKIGPRTMALVGIAGTTPLGAVDPIPELSQLAEENNLFLHVDAAFGGFVIPFARQLGRQLPEFGFRLAGVKSICIDPHKMGMAVIPAGGILFRQRELAEAIRVPVPYLAGGESALPTIIGTRSGAAVIATWAMLKHLGESGYRAVVKRCLELTDYLAIQLKAIPGLALVTEPAINIVGLKSLRLPNTELAQRLRSLGWAISLFDTHLRIVVMPHLRLSHLKHLLADLRRCIVQPKVHF